MDSFQVVMVDSMNNTTMSYNQYKHKQEEYHLLLSTTEIWSSSNWSDEQHHKRGDPKQRWEMQEMQGIMISLTYTNLLVVFIILLNTIGAAMVLCLRGSITAATL